MVQICSTQLISDISRPMKTKLSSISELALLRPRCGSAAAKGIFFSREISAEP